MFCEREETPISFRDNLQHLRDLQDMSQADLAQQIGVSRQSVAKWEAEKSYPEMDKLIKICDLFGCSLDDLVRGDLAGREAASAGSSVVEGANVVRCNRLMRELGTLPSRLRSTGRIVMLGARFQGVFKL